MVWMVSVCCSLSGASCDHGKPWACMCMCVCMYLCMCMCMCRCMWMCVCMSVCRKMHTQQHGTHTHINMKITSACACTKICKCNCKRQHTCDVVLARHFFFSNSVGTRPQPRISHARRSRELDKPAMVQAGICICVCVCV